MDIPTNHQQNLTPAECFYQPSLQQHPPGGVVTSSVVAPYNHHHNDADHHSADLDVSTSESALSSAHNNMGRQLFLAGTFSPPQSSSSAWINDSDIAEDIESSLGQACCASVMSTPDRRIAPFKSLCHHAFSIPKARKKLGQSGAGSTLFMKAAGTSFDRRLTSHDSHDQQCMSSTEDEIQKQKMKTDADLLSFIFKRPPPELDTMPEEVTFSILGI